MLARPIAVGLVSAATLVYEVLLVRLFAIEHFHHFAYMAVGVAMLGFGLSGTALAVTRDTGAQRQVRRLAWAAALTPILLLVSPALATRVSLDATRLAVDPGQWALVALLYALLALPFAGAALVILLSLALEVDRPGLTYGGSFLGSGAGALLSIALMRWVPLPDALSWSAVLAALGALAALRAETPRPARALTWLALALAASATAYPAQRLPVSPYKGLPQVEAFPGAQRVAQDWSPLGWVVAVDAPAFRFAPGLSLAYQGPFPAQTALFVDGELAGALTRGSAGAPEFLDWLPSSLPFALGARDRVAVIGAGAGLEVANALSHGASQVTAVELHGDLVRMADPGRNPRVRWIVQDARTFASRTSAQFDLVTLGLEGGPGGSAAGVRALSEDFLHTTDAYRAYLRLLRDGGVLAVTRWLSVPLREPVRVVMTAGEALRREGYRPSQALVVAHSWATVTVLARPGGFSTNDLQTLRAWTAQRQLDLDWYPGLTQPVERFHRLAEPVLFQAALHAAAGPDSARAFSRQYPFDVAPRSDARPYPHHYLRLTALPAFLARGQGDWLPFSEWGLMALVATLGQSLVAAFALLLLPALLTARARGERGLVRLGGYFALIGFAYLAAEIAAIQQLSLLLGHPVYGVAVVLAGLLIGSGVGSVWSDRRQGRAWVAPAVLALLAGILSATQLYAVHAAQPTPLAVRAVLALAALAPTAFLMGIPFPTGLRSLAGARTTRLAWAWAANGFASVAAAPVAALVALEAGSQVLLVTAAAAYGAAALLIRAAPA